MLIMLRNSVKRQSGKNEAALINSTAMELRPTTQTLNLIPVLLPLAATPVVDSGNYSPLHMYVYANILYSPPPPITMFCRSYSRDDIPATLAIIFSIPYQD